MLRIGESIGEIERDEDTDERISLANDDDGEIDDDFDDIWKLSGDSSCKKWHRGPYGPWKEKQINSFISSRTLSNRKFLTIAGTMIGSTENRFIFWVSS